MAQTSGTPDLSALEIPMDAWTQPYWDAAARGELVLPRCADCHRFRWPPGPFCPHCRSQRLEWRAPGPARIFSFTITRAGMENDQSQIHAPALVEFPEADGIRLLAAIVDTPISSIRIGAPLRLGWSTASNARVPVFSVATS